MVTFTYGLEVLTLPNPVFGNKESIEVRRINRKSRGGDLTVYRDPDWPKTIIITYEWTYLTEANYALLFQFVERTLGQVIQLLDYEGRLWEGIIITPGADFSETEIEDSGTSLQFQGEIIG